jgi:hypothetical protein
MFSPGDVISYHEMCGAEGGATLQRGMNFRLGGRESVILMSLRKGAPYADRIEDGGKTLIYEGHDVARRKGGPNPKKTNQPRALPSGKLTQNGLFYDVAARAKQGEASPERVRVYEKIKNGIWAFDGVFELLDAWQEQSKGRKVFKFKLTIAEDSMPLSAKEDRQLEHNRIIPSSVKIEVWKRDGGKCVKCGSKDNLHFDHDLPFSKGGSSILAKNIQLLCARHNLEKHDKIV